jgi:hypothetical protein
MSRIPKITREEFRTRMLDQNGIDIDAWIVLLNKDKHAAGETVFPTDLQVTVQRLRGTATVKAMEVEAKDLKKFQLSPKHRAQWNAGQAVLTKFGVFAQVDPRPATGQPETPLEWHVKDVLATNVFLASEYIALLFTKEALRDKAFDSLVSAWPSLFFAGGLLPEASEADIAARLRHLKTLQSRGRRDTAWGTLFASGVAPRDLVKHDQVRLASASSVMQKRETWFWQQCVRSLLVCQASAKRRRQATAEISDTIEQRGEEYPGQREDMVHGLLVRPHVADILPAVYSGMAPDTALELYLHLQTYAAEFRAVASLGALGRGVAAQLPPDAVESLVNILGELSERDENDVKSDEADNANLRLDFLSHIMAQLWSTEAWHERLTALEADPQGAIVLQSPRAIPS